MKSNLKLKLLILLALVSVPAFGQNTDFSYRGRLTAAGAPANSPHDMEFKLFGTADVGAGAQQGETISQAAVPVADGVFSVRLDFGAAVFDGSPRFLEIGVRPGGGAGPFTTLAPRQQVASIPYAIRSLTAGTAITAATATTLVDGAAVQSLNNLKDNVTLAAGANVSITPSGNTLTIASTGGSSLWSAGANNSTYYSEGNVGIGTSTPAHRLSLRGGPSWTANGWVGSVELPNGSALGWQANAAGQRFGMGHANTGFYLFRTASNPGTIASPALYDFVVNDDGNVGIGVNAPTPGYRLEVNGATQLRTANGTVQFGSPNAELGLSITPNAGNRADLRFDGSVLKLVASTGVTPPSAANGLAITTAGNVGIGTTAPVAKLHAETAQAGTAVYGHALGTSGIGVYGHAPNSGGIGVLASAGAGSVGIYAGNTAGGTAVHAEGNATQSPDKGGFVKAMAYIDPFLPAAQYVVRCYNSQLADNISSTAPCGITVTRTLTGHYTIDFGFKVDDRFISVTPQASLLSANEIVTGNITSAFGNRVNVIFLRTKESGSGFEGVSLYADDCRFHIMVH